MTFLHYVLCELRNWTVWYPFLGPLWHEQAGRVQTTCFFLLAFTAKKAKSMPVEESNSFANGLFELKVVLSPHVSQIDPAILQYYAHSNRET
jgi:hypothetical protein